MINGNLAEKLPAEDRADVVDAEWQPVGVVLNLRSLPCNRRAEAHRRARLRKEITQKVYGCLSILSSLVMLILAEGVAQDVLETGWIAGVCVCMGVSTLFARLAGLFAPPA